MKRGLIAIVIFVLASVFVLGIVTFTRNVLIEIFFATPSETTVRHEFLDRYPTAEIKNIELIFEQNGEVVYLITAREDESSGIGKYDFALTRQTGTWKWCDDQTDRKCGSIIKAR